MTDPSRRDEKGGPHDANEAEPIDDGYGYREECGWWHDGANPPDARYKIIRFWRDADNEVIETGLTLDEAQAHCRRDDTRGAGWFDGYEKEGR